MTEDVERSAAAPSTPPDEADWVPDPRRWRILSVSLVVGFMSLLDVSIVNVAIPSMQQGLDTSASAIQWVVSGYLLAFGLTLVAGGRLGDAYGRRRMMLIGLTGFIVSSAAVGFAPNVAPGHRRPPRPGRDGRPADAAELRARPGPVPWVRASPRVRRLRGDGLGVVGRRTGHRRTHHRGRRRGQRVAVPVPRQHPHRPRGDARRGASRPGPAAHDRAGRQPHRRGRRPPPRSHGALPALPRRQRRGRAPVDAPRPRRRAGLRVGVRPVGAAAPGGGPAAPPRRRPAARSARLHERSARRLHVLRRLHRHPARALGLPADRTRVCAASGRVPPHAVRPRVGDRRPALRAHRAAVRAAPDRDRAGRDDGRGLPHGALRRGSRPRAVWPGWPHR